MSENILGERRVFIRGRSEDIELLEKPKGVIEIGMPSTEGHETTGLTRIKHVFDLLDKELLEEFTEKGGIQSADIRDLNGLNSRRSEMAILAHILKLSNEGAKKTQLLYEANLSGKQLKNYLNFLTESGCLEEKAQSKGGVSYSTTPKGVLFLKYWTGILSLLESNPEAQ